MLVSEMLKLKIFFILLSVTMIVTLLTGCTSATKYNELKKDYDNSQTNLNAAQANLASAQHEYDTLKTQTDAAQQQLAADKTALQQQLTQTSDQLNQANTTINGLQTQLNSVLSTQRRMLYTFNYTNGYINKTFSWQLTITLKDYLYFHDKSHISDPTTYSPIVNDTYADAILDQVIQQIKDTTQQNNLTVSDTINLVGRFVQSLTFTNKNILTPSDDYVQYPLETLYVPGGDCEDNSLLVSALLQRLGYSTALIVFSSPQHVGVGVNLLSYGATNGAYEYQAKSYYYLETTGVTSYNLGVIPGALAGLQPTVYPVGE